MNTNKSLCIGAAMSVTFLIGCGTSQPITVQPALEEEEYSEVTCMDMTSKFYITDIQDKRGYVNPENIGFTQTGIVNRKTSLVSEPLPTEVIKKSVSHVLSRCKNVAVDRRNAEFLLTINLLGFQITEVTKAFSETIMASIAYEVVVLDTQSEKRVARFNVETTDSEKSIDTSKFAGQVAKNALRKSNFALISELEKTLNINEE